MFKDDQQLPQYLGEMVEILQKELDMYPPLTEAQKNFIQGVALEDLKKIKDAFHAFQRAIVDTIVAPFLVPAVWDFADVCITLEQIIQGETDQYKVGEQQVDQVVDLLRDSLLLNLFLAWQNKMSEVDNLEKD